MPCRLVQCRNIINWILRNKYQWNCNLNSNIFSLRKCIWNVVWKMVAIMPWPQCVKSVGVLNTNRFPKNRPVSQIPQCTSPISHNATFCGRNVQMRAHFCYKMVHCVIFVWCIVGLVWWVTEVLDTCNLMFFGISMNFFTSRFCPILWWLEHQYVCVCCTIPL